MKIKELNNKIVLAELDPKATYLLLFNPAIMVSPNPFKDIVIKGKGKVYLLPVRDIDKAIKFVEIPKKKKGGE